MGVMTVATLASVFLLCTRPDLQLPDSRTVLHGSIAGLVSVGGRPKSGATVILTKQAQGRPLTRTVTDADGYYQITNIAPGIYSVTVFAPGFVVAQAPGTHMSSGRTLGVADGERVEGVDFALQRGGVITGRIVDASGQPIVATTVNLTPLDESGKPTSFSVLNPAMHRTDDKGEYRLYGLQTGRYFVSVGEDAVPGPIPFPVGFYRRTFYPNVTSQAEASVIQLDEGHEVANIDIKVSSFSRSYSVSGRVFEARTRRPLSGVRFGYVALADDGKPDQRGSRALTDGLSTEAGEFRIEGLLPGRYAAWGVMLPTDNAANLYSDPINFEIKDADVRGVEIKIRRGASISGQAVFEGKPDASIVAKLTELFVAADVTPRVVEGLRTDFIPPKIAADGTFHIGGLRAGTAKLAVAARGDRSISLVRIERNGVVVPAIDLQEGEDVTGVRLILVSSTGSVRGQVSIEDGKLPAGLFVIGQRDDLKITWTAEVDERGYFMRDGLPAGEYELTLLQRNTSGNAGTELLKQTVTVNSDSQSQVTLTLNGIRRGN